MAIKNYIGKKSLRSWCEYMNYPYSVCLRLANDGASDQTVRRYMRDNYISRLDEARAEAYLTLLKIEYTSDIKIKAKLRDDYFIKYGPLGVNMSERIWTDIRDYAVPAKYTERWLKFESTDYEISSFGRIRKITTNGHIRLVKPYTHIAFGHYYLSVKINNKRYSVAKLVSDLFISKDVQRIYKIIMLDGDYCNCRLSNILRVLKSDNCPSPHNAIRVVWINDGYIIKKWESMRKCAKDMHLSVQAVSDLVNGRTQKRLYNLQCLVE